MRPNNENVICEENPMVSLPYHSDVGTLLKAKDSSFLPFFLLWLSASKYCSALCSGLRWYRDPRSKDREESDLLERERRKQDFNSCPASVLLRSTKLPYRGALTAASDTDTTVQFEERARYEGAPLYR